jgi:hypothetical protein
MPSGAAIASLANVWVAGAGDQNWSFTLQQYSSQPAIRVYLRSDTNQLQVMRWSGLTELSAGSTSHLAWKWDASELQASQHELLIDGVSKGNGTIEVANQYSVTGNLSAGFGIATGTAALGQNLFDGVIDDVQVWNTVLSNTDINNNKSVVRVGNESGLVGYWTLDANGDDKAGTLDLNASASAPTHVAGLFTAE